MRDVLRHRGPDDAGSYLSEYVGLGHRRLSIVDLKNGRQPMSTADGRYHIVFNGEIYNHRACRPGLEQAGYAFRTHSDTEVVLNLYAQYGPVCVDHLRGMFAFAIWDSQEKLLFLARDRLGIKPLYYHAAQDGTLVFGSEIKSILASRKIRPEIDAEVLPDYLVNSAPSGDRTLFRHIRRLPPGHHMIWRDGQLSVSRYWTPPLAPDDSHPAGRDDKVVAEWLDLFTDAVDSHLMADVPLGVLLSGGIDSTAIAGVLRQRLGKRFKTFSVAFDEEEANELNFAREAAEAFQTDHFEVILSPAEYFELLPRLLWHEDEPVAHTASIPLYKVCELASQQVKVVLTGEGSDELMAGYARYQKTLYNMQFGRWYQALAPAALRRWIAARIAADGTSRARAKLERTFLGREVTFESLYLDNFGVFRSDDASAMVRAGKAGGDGLAAQRGFMKEAEGYGLLNQMLYVDSQSYLQELLMKQDQMSMAASIESRVPFLDRDLVDYTMRLPDEMKLRHLKTKYILRAAMKGIIPESILKRPKMGFPVPLGKWLRGTYQPILQEFVLGDRARERNLFDHTAVTKLAADHQSGSRDNASRLWLLINLEIWHRQFVDGDDYEMTTDQVRLLLR